MNYEGNYIAMDNPSHSMSPNYRWSHEEPKEKCSYYCGGDAVTNNRGEACCNECLAEVQENDREWEAAQTIANIQEAFTESIFKR